MLFLKAAMAMAQAAAAEAGNHSPDVLARAVPGLLDQADEHAEHLGHDANELWTSFGPTNCELYRVAAHIQLSQGADAAAASLANLPRERRAHLLTDRALGEKQAGQRETAVDTLLEAEELAPEEVVCRPRTKRLVEAAHPAVARHVDFLREPGVTVLLGEGGFALHKPKHGNPDTYPWQAAIDALPV
ncbi:hypothetical protein ACFVWY_33385 [Streptomyces sp. NPDC058195]|uniref:hypothetical protein n=1 Tax=Streptomyces sp. NPDC058195 TaxID=3346375 RepID=UPI0036E6C7FF